MCKLFRLIVPGCLKETVPKACAKYAASTLAKFEVSRIIRIEQAILQEDIHASHERSKQCTKSYDGPQLLVHHLQNKLLRLVHIHLVDALADDGADVNALKYLRKMIGDNSLINPNRSLGFLCVVRQREIL